MKSCISNKISREFGHCNCLLCGDDNPIGLGLKFKLLKDGRVNAFVKASKIFQGYNGIVHGGVMCALLDSAMVHCLFHHDIKAVTADMNVRFVNPIPCDIMIDLYGELLSQKRKIFYMKAVIFHNNNLMVEANARFMKKSCTFLFCK